MCRTKAEPPEGQTPHRSALELTQLRQADCLHSATVRPGVELLPVRTTPTAAALEPGPRNLPVGHWPHLSTLTQLDLGHRNWSLKGAVQLARSSRPGWSDWSGWSRWSHWSGWSGWSDWPDWSSPDVPPLQPAPPLTRPWRPSRASREDQTTG